MKKYWLYATIFLISVSACQVHKNSHEITKSINNVSETCEQKCYDDRNACINRNGNSHSCDEAYDVCKSKCN